MDIKKELSYNQVILFIMPGKDYNNELINMMKQLSGKKVCYVTLNKTFDSLKETFSKKKIDLKNTVFIDAISKTIKQVPDFTDGCYFVSSPAAMTELSITIEKFLRHEFEYLVFDSLTNLLIYEKKSPVTKFMLSLVNKVRGSRTKSVFYALEMSQQVDIIEAVESFVDKVIDLSK